MPRAAPLSLRDLLRFTAREPDEPHLAPGVRLLDISIESRALGHPVAARLLCPAKIATGATLPVVYLLHEEGGSFRSWSNQSEVSALAAGGMVLVMPDAAGTLYVDDMRGWTGYYEHFLTSELASAVRRRFPFASGLRAQTAVVGVASGGYGAAVLGLKHAGRFGFVAGLGATLDIAQRGFRWQSPLDYLLLRRTFGPVGSEMRLANDPFTLLHNMPPAQAPFFWLRCGDRDALLKANQQFTGFLREQEFAHDFQEPRGGGNWAVWDAQLPQLEIALQRFFSGCGVAGLDPDDVDPGGAP